MFHLKEIGIGSAALIAIIGGSITIANENEKSKLNAYVNAININNLPGNFIIIEGYEPLTYHIDETVFNLELKNYMNETNKKLKYSYKIKGDDVRIKYRYKGKSKVKVYHLQANA